MFWQGNWEGRCFQFWNYCPSSCMWKRELDFQKGKSFSWSITNSCFREIIFLFEESRLKSLTKPLFLFWVLYKVWNLYKKGRLCEAVDPVLEANFQEVEASRLLQIGLVCAQSLMLRPSISVVVKMPTDQHEIPQPT